MYAVVTFPFSVCQGESWHLLLPLKISLFQMADQEKKNLNELIEKSHVPRALHCSSHGPSS